MQKILLTKWFLVFFFCCLGTNIEFAAAQLPPSPRTPSDTDEFAAEDGVQSPSDEALLAIMDNMDERGSVETYFHPDKEEGKLYPMSFKMSDVCVDDIVIRWLIPLPVESYDDTVEPYILKDFMQRDLAKRFYKQKRKLTALKNEIIGLRQGINQLGCIKRVDKKSNFLFKWVPHQSTFLRQVGNISHGIRLSPYFYDQDQDKQSCQLTLDGMLDLVISVIPLYLNKHRQELAPKLLQDVKSELQSVKHLADIIQPDWSKYKYAEARKESDRFWKEENIIHGCSFFR